ncbi:hypothetical protein [Aurantimonas sp. VKM B-3413]|uniref:hypothetical protein n=1 Tax=Aurantimonas sp. VKM B-3413 TaxID=2779401 RepID=UPI001E4E30C7|nr:hypothetical protein [Aurantimonas sp. VKM B-3413]MCB8840216.1 hypothetical protein [Aurantimonas sp. VKM B-3413]
MTEVALAEPAKGVVEIGRPNEVPMSDPVERFLKMTTDTCMATADPQARYLGTELAERSLVPGKGACLSKIRFLDWFSRAPLLRR